jgi:hypothetical protein
VSVVNATNRAKAVRVRFLEGRNGKPVLDFNLYLSPFDAWIGAVAAGGANGPATLVTGDRSCTVPELVGPVAFSDARYTGANQDWDGATTVGSLAALLGSVERTREGHIEMIEMGVLRTGTLPTQLAEEVTHRLDGVPTNCRSLLDAWAPPAGGWALDAQASLDLPAGGLYGGAAIVDVAEGTLLGYPADAIEGFYTNAAQPGFLHRSPLQAGPDLGDADNGQGTITVGLLADDGAFITQQVPARRRMLSIDQPYSFDAVSLLFQQGAIHNEFVSEPALGAQSAWVMTFPTRSAYVDVRQDERVRAPFTDAFGDDGTACEAVDIEAWDREERTARRGIDPFGPTPPPPPVSFVCHQTSVAAFNPPPSTDPRDTLLGSALAFGLKTNSALDPGILSGWSRIVFDDPARPALQNVLDNRANDPAAGVAFAGLPVTGFWAANYVNANASPGILANYNGTVRHRTMRSVVAQP